MYISGLSSLDFLLYKLKRSDFHTLNQEVIIRVTTSNVKLYIYNYEFYLYNKSICHVLHIAYDTESLSTVELLRLGNIDIYLMLIIALIVYIIIVIIAVVPYICILNVR